jgi:hypothetical protein
MLQQIAPYIGYLASLFLVISLIVHGDIKFRLYNLLGCACFIFYGFIFHAFPVILTNVILFVINFFYLLKLYRHREDFELIEIKGDEKLIEKFIAFYKNDIASFYPNFDTAQLAGNINYIVLRDLVIANIFSVKVLDNGDALVLINYTIKKYRDYKVSKFLFEKEQLELSTKGIKRILYDNVLAEKYTKFFKVMNFENDGKYFYKTIS